MKKFHEFGLKKLISTSFAPEAKAKKYDGNLPLYCYAQEHGCETPDNEWGRVYTLTRSKMKREQIDFANLEWTYLKGDGDFRSDEVRKLRDEADIVVTNPPFSQLRDFFVWVMEKHKNISPHGKITGHGVLYGAAQDSSEGNRRRDAKI